MKTVSDFSEDRPFDHLLKPIVAHAKLSNAEEIYFDSHPNTVHTRIRVDGAIISTEIELTKQQLKSLVQQLKAHFGTDMTSSLTQGQLEFEFASTLVTLRVQTIETVHGPAMIMRFASEMKSKPLDQLGFDKEAVDLIKASLKLREGVTLITGPTGSGKTTRCSSLLQSMETKDNRVLIIEETKEINIELENLIHLTATSKKNNNFKTTFNAALRMRPDTIVVGETRNPETAKALYQAASIGERVITTFHAYNAISALQRLESFGVDSYELSTSTNLIISLSRDLKLCPSCRKKFVLSKELIDYLEIADSMNFKDGDVVYKRNKKGCDKCNLRGTIGRVTLYDILEVTDEIAGAIKAKDYARISELRDPRFTFKAVKERLIRQGDIQL